MKRSLFSLATVCVLAFVSLSAQGKGWVTLFDGKNLNNFNQVGDANWTLANGIVEATKGPGYLVTKQSYGDFELKVEFWVDSGTANSGVYIRCQDGTKITDTTCYEANIFDTRPDQTGRTGSIVHVSKPSTNIDAAGKWNTYEITARGPRLIVKLNGTETVNAEDKKFARGPIALQYMAGTVRFRNVQIRPIS
ncbi:MAG TPA: DUF1080 domain-containing protein [Longimicrobiales bacterium]|nr:DUF1080 domain-containing protein [Longimicrobiales bacterium]